MAFLRGDSDLDGTVAISDVVKTLTVLFLGAGELACEDAGDSDDGVLAVNDASSSARTLTHP